MFAPNSIKSLLRKKQMRQIQTRIESSININEKPLYDPDFEQIIDTKCVIKEIDMHIKNIKQWRQQQRKNLQRNLKMNQQISKMEYETETQQQQNKELQKFKKHIEEQKNTIQQIIKEDSKVATNPFQNKESQILNQILNQKLNQFDRKKQILLSTQNNHNSDNHEAFVQSLKNINNIFTNAPKKSNVEITNKKLQKDKIKDQLNEIDQQLKELQQLLKDN